MEPRKTSDVLTMDSSVADSLALALALAFALADGIEDESDDERECCRRRGGGDGDGETYIGIVAVVVLAGGEGYNSVKGLRQTG